MEGVARAASSEPTAVLDPYLRDPTPQEIREALSAVLLSVPFRTSKQSQHLLQYLVDQRLEGRDEMLKERIVGANVFDRNPDYDTGDDPIVRVRAVDLRKRLTQYYAAEGADSPIRIEIHPGSYRPVFVTNAQRAMAQAADALATRKLLPASDFQPVEIVATSTVADSPSESLDTVNTVAKIVDPIRWMRITLAIAGLIIILLAAGCVTMWNHIQSTNRSLYPWRYEPSVAAFWSGFLDSNKPTDIVMSDSSFSLVQDLFQQSFTLQDYLSRSYVTKLGHLPGDQASQAEFVAGREITSEGEVQLVQKLAVLDPLHEKMHVYNAHEYMSDLLRQDNVILIGSRISDPWDELFDSRLNFTFSFGPNGKIINHAPKAGEQSAYASTPTISFCILAYLPNPGHSGKVILIEGASTEATEAAGEFLLSQDSLSKFEQMLHVSQLPYFEVLLKTSEVRGTPLSTTIEAYRTYPNLQ